MMRGVDNEQGWKRLAAAVRQRREDRDLTQLDVATRGGPSIDRIQAIEGARLDRYAPRTFSKLERALEWESGSCRAILAGGDPTPIESVEAPIQVEAPKLTLEGMAAQMEEMQRKIDQLMEEQRKAREQRERDQRETM